jgi:hypothetical protein
MRAASVLLDSGIASIAPMAVEAALKRDASLRIVCQYETIVLESAAEKAICFVDLRKIEGDCLHHRNSYLSAIQDILIALCPLGENHFEAYCAIRNAIRMSIEEESWAEVLN